MHNFALYPGKVLAHCFSQQALMFTWAIGAAGWSTVVPVLVFSAVQLMVMRHRWFGKGTRRGLEVSWEGIKGVETLTPSSLETGVDLCWCPVMPALSEFVPLL